MTQWTFLKRDTLVPEVGELLLYVVTSYTVHRITFFLCSTVSSKSDCGPVVQY